MHWYYIPRILFLYQISNYLFITKSYVHVGKKMILALFTFPISADVNWHSLGNILSIASISVLDGIHQTGALMLWNHINTGRTNLASRNYAYYSYAFTVMLPLEVMEFLFIFGHLPTVFMDDWYYVIVMLYTLVSLLWQEIFLLKLNAVMAINWGKNHISQYPSFFHCLSISLSVPSPLVAAAHIVIIIVIKSTCYAYYMLKFHSTDV